MHALSLIFTTLRVSTPLKKESGIRIGVNEETRLDLLRGRGARGPPGHEAGGQASCSQLSLQSHLPPVQSREGQGQNWRATVTWPQVEHQQRPSSGDTPHQASLPSRTLLPPTCRTNLESIFLRSYLVSSYNTWVCITE